MPARNASTSLNDVLYGAKNAAGSVSVDALPICLNYLRSGHVQVLLAQQCHAWGYRSVEHLFNKVHLHKNPDSPRDVSPLVRVDRSNVDAYAKNWEKGLPK